MKTVSEKNILKPTNLEDYVHENIDVSWERCSGCQTICEDFGGVCPIVDVKFVTIEQVKEWIQQHRETKTLKKRLLEELER